MLAPLVAVAVAMVLAWWSWRGRLQNSVARWAAAARFVALLALLLLWINPTTKRTATGVGPVVLVDNSVSMHSAAGQFSAADSFARSLGDVTYFGELAPGVPGAPTELQTSLAAATSTGRPVVVVSDGEVSGRVPDEALAQTSVHLFPRKQLTDIGLLRVDAPARVAAGDSVLVNVDISRSSAAPDSAVVVAREGTVVFFHTTAHFGSADHVRARLAGVFPHGTVGQHWLEIARVGDADGEPSDDVRWWNVTITPTPGVVVVMTSPDWDSRALYRTIADVAGVPVRGYAQLQRGSWRRVDDLRAVTSAEVMAAARESDLLVVRGDPAPWAAFGKSQLLWPASNVEGDWYAGPGGASPVSDAFAGVEVDSLPAVTAIRIADTTGESSWVGATARRSRRGVPVPIVAGRTLRGRRVVTIGADGLARWALRGGVADQAWRVLVADATAWLLGSEGTSTVDALPVARVVQQGHPVEFRWTGSGVPRPLAIDWQADGRAGHDTLRFGASGVATLALRVGRYRYGLPGNVAGEVQVEPFSDEIWPAPVTLVTHRAAVSSGGSRRSLRDVLPLFLVAIAAFGAEWFCRRRLGLR